MPGEDYTVIRNIHKNTYTFVGIYYLQKTFHTKMENHFF